MKISLIQLNSLDDPEENLLKASRFMETAFNERADLILLPEYSNYLGPWEKSRALAENGQKDWARKLAKQSQSTNTPIAAGLLYRENDKLYSSLWFFLPEKDSEPLVYKKLHLFKLDWDKNNSLDESRYFSAGSAPLIFEHAGRKFGAALCYDLRFPELFRFYSARGAEILLIPSAFTHKTGEAHWKTLCQARSIENQCFVAAVNQVGPYDGGESYGHSLVVSPWGEVLLEAPGKDNDDKEGVFTVEIDLTEINKAAARIPVQKHRRQDLFG
ncbi:MAG: hypothetical protein JXR70_13125 [Spirochaetales bacterium]|nr:hypothetical protein [Spirochaetales bacterium]